MKDQDQDKQKQPLLWCSSLAQLQELFNLPDQYGDVKEIIQDNVLGFCCCGRPEENLKYVLGGLRLIDSKTRFWNTKESSDSEEARGDWWTQYNQKLEQHFGNTQAEYFFYYWADTQGLTEHGSSVPGWLSETGQKLLTILEELEQHDKTDSKD